MLTPQISGDPTLPGELTVKESSRHCPLIVWKSPAAVGWDRPFNMLNEVSKPVAGFVRTNAVKSNLREGEFVDYSGYDLKHKKRQNNALITWF